MSKKQLRRSLLILPVLLLLATTLVFLFRPHNGAQADPSTVTGTHHYFYTFPNGTMNVYDMDNNFALVQSVSIPTTNVRGVVFDPQSGMLYFSDGGNGGSNGTGVLIKYNLVTQAVVYKQSYPFGVDSMAITPDGKTIYMPDGSASTDGTWHIISTATGQVTGSILTAAGVAPHDTDMSANGQYVYMEGVTSNVLYVASIATNQIVQKVQPFTHLIRPFVVNQSGTLAYVTENGIIGFGVGNLQTGNVLYNVSAPGFSLPPGFDTTYTTPSHGISLSPDGKTVYVVDMPNSYVHVFNVNGLPNTAPTMTASIPITPISGTESPCKIDCSKEGWLEQSLDGRYLFVGNSGSIIDTTTDQVVANLNTLSDTRMFLEVDWVNGVPVNSEDRTDFYWNSGPTTPTPTSTPTLPPVSGPVSKVWYFAEGRVGAGFSEFLTLGNPTGTACQVNLTYLTQPDSGTGGTKTFSFSVPASTRVTRWVDSDLGTSTSGHGISDAATITVDTATTPNCSGIVAERPMYFNALGTNSGSDVLGVTHTSTTFSFADMAVGTQAGGGSVSSFLPILNPGTATVTATYYAAGAQVGTQTLAVAANSRGTIFPSQASPALPSRVSVVLTSSQPVVSERPTYFSSINGGNAGIVSGGADVIGVQQLANDWLFAEGYTGGRFQENFVLANLDPARTAATVTITLEYNGGASKAFTVTVNPLSQVIWNVNANSTGAGSSQSVSAEITSSGAQIAVEREMYFGYDHVGDGRTTTATGGSDVLGQVGPASKSDYSFAEGYTNLGYDEWLTIQNPTANTETVNVTVSNGVGTVYTFAEQVVGHSRSTVDMVAIVQQHVFHGGNGYPGYEISMAVQSSNGPFVVERPMYWNASGTQGGSDVIGYSGG